MAADMEGDRGLVVRDSRYSYQETVERLIQGIRQHGAELFAHIDHAANATRVGLHMNPAAVLIFGDPAVGTPAMTESPDFALELPSRILIRARDDGSVIVVHHDAARLATTYGIGSTTAKTLAGLARIVDAALSLE